MSTSSLDVSGNQPIVFDKKLGYRLYRNAVVSFPKDTGNAASGIRLPYNLPKRKRIMFPADKAHYYDILDKGLSPGKGSYHKGIISQEIFGQSVAITKGFFQDIPVGRSLDEKHLTKKGGVNYNKFLKSSDGIGEGRYNSNRRYARRVYSQLLYEKALGE